LRLHTRRFGESYLLLHRAIIRPGESFHTDTLKGWASGRRVPRRASSMEVLGRIEKRYGLPNGYFKSKLPHLGRATAAPALPGIGPHNIRDVLATHILKQTGSYERASYAIQGTPDMVAKHYGRFLPQGKSALAAQILNQVWIAA
jgi:hypothetical protein